MRDHPRPHLAAMARPRYVQLSGYAQAANCTLAVLESRAQLIVPVVAMVGGSIVQGMNSKGPEYVPPEVLANFPESFNGRPIVPVHPYDGTGSANDPVVQDKYRFGQVFNSRVEEGETNLKLDAWLDIDRATALGGEPASVVADCQAGKLVQVSLGAWIVMSAEEGELEDGRVYQYIWRYITSYDHLAMGLAGLEGACSVDMGCGAPRLYTAAGQAIALSSDSPTPMAAAPDLSAAPVLRSNVLAKARRPTFSGTETTTWSAPSWHEWVTALHTGTESPKSITDATATLKASIARHTLLGDPNADNTRDLTLFPVVNPHSGRLNEKALRAVIGGRGSAADIPDTAKSSAQDMARTLLKSEFDIEIAETESDPKESANMAVPAFTATAAPTSSTATAPPVPPEPKPDRSPKLLARMLASLSALTASFRANGGTTNGVSDSELRAALWNELRASEPAFGWGSYYYGSYDAIIDVYFAENTVVYVTCPYDDVIYWRQTYTVDGEGKVTLNGDREQVAPDYNWKPITTSATAPDDDSAEPVDMPVGDMSASASGTPATPSPACGCHSTTSTAATLSTPASASDPAPAAAPETVSTEGDPVPMAATAATAAIKTLVARLVANSSGVFTADQIPQLEAFPEAQLTAMCEKFAPVAASGADPSHAAQPAAAPAVIPAAAASPAEPPAVVSANATTTPAAEPEPFDAFLSRAPIEFQSFYAQTKAAMDQRKTALLAAIGGKSKATAAMLTAAPVGIEQLEAVATELGCFTPTPIPSYGASGLPMPIPGASANTTPRYTPPKIYDMALHAMGKPGIGETEPPVKPN